MALLAWTGALSGCGGSPAAAEAPRETTAPASVIDMHAHVVFEADEATAMSAQHPPTPAGLRALLADPRLDRLAAIVIAPSGQPDRVTALNDRLLALVREEPRLFAVASVHPLDGERALAEDARVQAAGARMLKLHQNTQRFDLADPAVAAVVAQAGSVGLPVLFEGTSVLEPGTVGKFVKLAATNPKSRIVVAHMGHADFQQMLVFKTLERYPWWPRNVYFDLSATITTFADSPYAPHLVWTIRQLGVDRVMFGSDFPVATPAEALAAFDRLGFTAEERRALLHDTAATLLGL